MTLDVILEKLNEEEQEYIEFLQINCDLPVFVATLPIDFSI